MGDQTVLGGPSGLKEQSLDRVILEGWFCTCLMPIRGQSKPGSLSFRILVLAGTRNLECRLQVLVAKAERHVRGDGHFVELKVLLRALGRYGHYRGDLANIFVKDNAARTCSWMRRASFVKNGGGDFLGKIGGTTPSTVLDRCLIA